MRRLREGLRGQRQEDGLTLVELLVTMFLMSVISSLVLGAVVQSSRVLVRNEDEERGLQDAKVILDRLGRDVRESRGVVCDGGLADPTDSASSDPNCQSHLQLWVDSNSDYVKQDAEVISWRLQRNPDGQHFDVWRATGPSATPISKQRQASTLIVRFAFTYDNSDFSKVQQVNMRMKYDAFVDRGSGERWVAFAARLRNKGDR